MAFTLDEMESQWRMLNRGVIAHLDFKRMAIAAMLIRESW